MFRFSLQLLLEASFTWINVYHITHKMFTEMYASLYAECFSLFLNFNQNWNGSTDINELSNVKFHENLFTSSQVMQANKYAAANTHIFLSVHYQYDKKTPLPEQV
jgi:hypothetical protein